MALSAPVLEIPVGFDSATGAFNGRGKRTKDRLRREEREIFERPTRSLIEVTDVGDGSRDFDALTTIAARHLRLNTDQTFSTGDDPYVLRYAADFFTEIQSMSIDVIHRSLAESQENKRNIPADVLRAIHTIRTTTQRVLLNSAPRNQKVQQHRNGRDFHLGLTTDGVEICAVPVECLAFAKDKLQALFRIPTAGHPLAPKGEQFRSSLFGMTAHLTPEHLEPLWRRDEDSLRTLHQHIPEVRQPVVAFKDKPFCNRRVFVPQRERFFEQLDLHTRGDNTVEIILGDTVLQVHRVSCLAEIPDGEWGIYGNVADTDIRKSGYVELNRRLNDGASIEDPAERSDAHLPPCDSGLGVRVRINGKR